MTVNFSWFSEPMVKLSIIESILTFCPLGNSSCCRLLIFLKSIVLKNSFRNTNRVSNSLDPDKVQCFVGPDMDPTCLQMLSAEDTGRNRVKQSN